jgi:hypothetical protein
MGFFSWITQDTGRSICNAHSNRQTFKVVMSDNQGHHWVELDYGGYGIFGGKDYYVLLDEMNGGTGDRQEGINKAFSKDDSIIYPSLTESGAYHIGLEPPHCDEQGFFYSDDDDDEDDIFDTYEQAVSDWEWK